MLIYVTHKQLRMYALIIHSLVGTKRSSAEEIRYVTVRHISCLWFSKRFSKWKSLFLCFFHVSLLTHAMESLFAYITIIFSINHFCVHMLQCLLLGPNLKHNHIILAADSNIYIHESMVGDRFHIDMYSLDSTEILHICVSQIKHFVFQHTCSISVQSITALHWVDKKISVKLSLKGAWSGRKCRQKEIFHQE